VSDERTLAVSDHVRWRASGYSLREALRDLSDLATRLAINLPAAIDAKMAINRARRWRVDGNGHGAHVKEGS